ncbi:hypothetical protein ACO22_08097, partial [Paracoccidioides brasiliensis]
ILYDLSQKSLISSILFLLYVEPLLQLIKDQFEYTDNIAILETKSFFE